MTRHLAQLVTLLEGDKINLVQLHAVNLIQVEMLAQQMWNCDRSQLPEKVKELHELVMKMLKDLVKLNKDLLVGEKDKARRVAIKSQIEEIQSILTLGDVVFLEKV